MSMITKCPSCGTTFRVTPPQLQAQQGRVRCGRCAVVFDGFNTLATLRDDSPLVAAPSTAVPARDQPAITDVPVPPASEIAPALAAAPQNAAPQPDFDVSPPPLPDVALDADAAGQAQFDVAREPPVGAPPQPDPASETRAPVVPEPTPGASHPPRRRAGWAFGTALLLIALGAQGAYFYRGEIAARVPELQLHLNRMCELLRCTVALPQRPRQISIEASDMQAPDPAKPGLIALTATLRNQAATVLGYPALDVVLTNVKEHTVARRIFLPAEYLDAGKDSRAGIQPNAEVTLRLNLETGDLGAAGFRLDLLAAPAP